MAPDHRKQIDNLKKFSVDFRVSISVINTIISLCASPYALFSPNFSLSYSLVQTQTLPLTR